MKAFFKALILVPLILAVVGLSVANRAPVDVSLDPFALSLTDLRLTAPLFVVILGAVALGALIGGVAAWIVQGKHRRAARDWLAAEKNIPVKTPAREWKKDRNLRFGLFSLSAWAVEGLGFEQMAATLRRADADDALKLDGLLAIWQGQ